MQQGDAQIREHIVLQRLRPLLRGLERLAAVSAVVLDGRADDEALVALGCLLAHEGIQPRAVALVDQERLDRLAAGRQLVDDGNVEIAVDDQSQRARDGRGGQQQQVRLRALGAQGGALGHAEAVLLICDDHAEAGKAGPP